MGDVKLKIKQNKISFKSDIEPEVKDLITRMLQVDPKKRPSVSQILRSPFITRFNQSIDDQFFSNPAPPQMKSATNRQTKKKNIRPGLNRVDTNVSKGGDTPKVNPK